MGVDDDEARYAGSENCTGSSDNYSVDESESEEDDLETKYTQFTEEVSRSDFSFSIQLKEAINELNEQNEGDKARNWMDYPNTITSKSIQFSKLFSTKVIIPKLTNYFRPSGSSGDISTGVVTIDQRPYRRGVKNFGDSARTARRHKQQQEEEVAETAKLKASMRPLTSLYNSLPPTKQTTSNGKAKGSLSICKEPKASETLKSPEVLKRIDGNEAMLAHEFQSSMYYRDNLIFEAKHAINSMEHEEAWYNDMAVNNILEYQCARTKTASISSLTQLTSPPTSNSRTSPQVFNKWLAVINNLSHWYVITG
ncbi:hypothetical protein HDU67_005316, partial [Dinochytrium kinnereticum]